MVALCLGATSGCLGVFADDGSSVSVGSHAKGALLHGVLLPEDGAGYRVPAAWRPRQRQYGTEEVVRWLTGAFRRVASELPGSVASVGDLSSQGGGRSLLHKSHGSGRDVDIFYYAIDHQGRPVLPERAMLRFGPGGRAVAWSPPSPDRPPPPRRGLWRRFERPAIRIFDPLPEARFDARRNWALVRALLSDPSVEVQWIFIHHALADLMLREGPSAGDDPALVARAAALMHQPTDAQAHDDHMHVRVYCEPTDRDLGCLDRGPQRWWKKRWKDLAAHAPFGPTLAASTSTTTSTTTATTTLANPGLTPAAPSAPPAVVAASVAAPPPGATPSATEVPIAAAPPPAATQTSPAPASGSTLPRLGAARLGR